MHFAPREYNTLTAMQLFLIHRFFTTDRHSKFASFQRQLNYFGFRKIAGKGKMSPCSYVNDAATSDIRSLLLIKRKTNGSAARKAAMQQRASDMIGAFNPALAGMNLQALAAAGGQNLGGINGQALNSAMALLQENAFRAGLGQLQFGQNNPHAQLSLLALQQQQQQLQELQNQQLRAAVNQSASNSMPAPAPVQDNSNSNNQNQQNLFTNSTSGNGSFGTSVASIEQLQAHLAALAGQNGNNGINNNNISNFQNFMQLKQQNNQNNAGGDSGFSSASAALQAQSNSSNPATAAMDAAASSNQTSINMFDSAANLQSLLNSHPGFQGNNDNNNNIGRGGMSSHLLNRLPSSGAIFPENSTLSFGGLLGSSNRLSSLLSLNSFGGGSREASLADLAAASSMGQFSAPAHLHQQRQT